MKPIPYLTGEIKVDLYFSDNYDKIQQEALMKKIEPRLVDDSLRVDVEQTVKLHFGKTEYKAEEKPIIVS